MMSNNAVQQPAVIVPLRDRILIRRDDDRSTTKGGIVLPDDAKIPTISGRVVAISPDLNDSPTYPVKMYDKVIVDPRSAIPVDLDHDNKLFIVPADDVIAVYKQPD